MRIIFTHPNALYIFNKNQYEPFMALPPTDKSYSFDIININNDEMKNYCLDFTGLILMTTPRLRKLFCKGKLIAQIKRNKKK